MQQTNKYKLNLMEKNDVFSPDPLNENAQKMEAALDTKADLAETGQYFSSLAGRLAAVEANKANVVETNQSFSALDGRISALEAQHVVLGTYRGDATAGRVIPLGFTPTAVLMFFQSTSTLTFINLMTKDSSILGSLPEGVNPADAQGIAEGGFFVSHPGRWNASNIQYLFLALG